MEAVKDFASSMRLLEDIHPSFSRPLTLLLPILARAQRVEDPPKAAAAGLSAEARQAALSPEALEMAGHILRFACAAYGHALLAMFKLMPLRPPAAAAAQIEATATHQMAPDTTVGTRFSVRAEALERWAISTYTGIADADLVSMKMANALADVVGDADCLRHFVAVNHSTSAIVLALRGTASVSDAIHDVVAYAEPFCGGSAHAGMARMARNVWAAAGPAVVEQLASHEGYGLVICGHSLGAGVAALLTLYLYEERAKRSSRSSAATHSPIPSQATRIRCFAFACPPVYAPLSSAPPGSLDAVAAFVGGVDCVPTLSVAAGRLLFAQLHTLDVAPLKTFPSLRWAGSQPASHHCPPRPLQPLLLRQQRCRPCLAPPPFASPPRRSSGSSFCRRTTNCA